MKTEAQKVREQRFGVEQEIEGLKANLAEYGKRMHEIVVNGELSDDNGEAIVVSENIIRMRERLGELKRAQHELIVREAKAARIEALEFEYRKQYR